MLPFLFFDIITDKAYLSNFLSSCSYLFINAVNFPAILQTAGNYSTLVSNVCGISVECVAAQANLATNTVCTTAFSTGNDTDAICMGTCQDLFDAIISSCDATVSQTTYITGYLSNFLS